MRISMRTRVTPRTCEGRHGYRFFAVLAPALAGSFLAAGLGCGEIVEGSGSGGGGLFSDSDGSSSSTSWGDLSASIGDSSPGNCGTAQSLALTSPGESAVNPVWIAVDAGPSVVRVVYEAEGAQLLGESSDAGVDFGIEVTFETLGPRTIQATAYDGCDEVVGTTSQVTVVSDEETDELGDPVCYPGPTEEWDVCFDLVIPEPSELDNYEYPPKLDMNPNYRAPQAYVDLASVDLGVSVAPNFRLSELVKPKYGEFVVIQPHAVVHLQALRDQLGPLQVNSGYRNPVHNASVGGATWSRHMYGDAFDLSPSDVSLTALFEACADEGAGFRKLYETHVHCDWRAESVDTRFFGPIDADAIAPADSLSIAAELVVDGEGFLAPASGWNEGEPLRRWWAFDDGGLLLGEAVGRRFVPPVGTVKVEVEVGGELRRSIEID